MEQLYKLLRLLNHINSDLELHCHPKQVGIPRNSSAQRSPLDSDSSAAVIFFWAMTVPCCIDLVLTILNPGFINLWLMSTIQYGECHFCQHTVPATFSIKITLWAIAQNLTTKMIFAVTYLKRGRKRNMTFSGPMSHQKALCGLRIRTDPAITERQRGEGFPDEVEQELHHLSKSHTGPKA